ncbi:tRNA (adenosine(37)-N6)-threonylcarbamoyltransferase complex ATPase subunit type 1 TsaE [Schumannella luteola]|uniref:tRNA threonylcarbamoyladenosine biosynthesis protein TsaE n=2 Tax=Schumannella luteola TaxID=472059 RepID=A0A852YCB4_9MICO|nr:tRNA threonylcarbamoyl adenosine modification protein YjeE [Schumannella luteola]
MTALELTIPDTSAMEELGIRLAAHLRAGDLIQLDGELGAGKTTLTRGIGEGLRVRGAVTSPTFVLARTHPTAVGVPLVHVDAYRLSSALELDDLDIDWAGSITVVEWGAGKLDGVSDSWLRIAIERRTGAAADAALRPGDEVDADEEPRHVVIEGIGPRWADLPPLD